MMPSRPIQRFRGVPQYTGPDGEQSVVASFDIYDFMNGEVATIISYTVEVAEDRPTDVASVHDRMR